MRRSLTVLTASLAIVLSMLQPAGRVQAQGYSGALPNVRATAATGLGLTYTAGAVVAGGSSQSITGSTLTATDAMTDCAAPTYTSCNIVYWASSTSLSITTNPLTAFKAGQVVVAFVTATGGNISAVVPASRNVATPSLTFTDGAFNFPPSTCVFVPTTTAAASGWPKFVQSAAGQVVNQFKTDTTAGTVAITCRLTLPTRQTSGTGPTVTSVDLLYSVGTTTLSAAAAPTISTVTGPAVGGSAAGTVSTTACGTLTITPVSLQLVAVTTGLYYHEKATCGTPLALTTDVVEVNFNQSFTTAGSTATIIELGGLTVYYKGIK